MRGDIETSRARLAAPEVAPEKLVREIEVSPPVKSLPSKTVVDEKVALAEKEGLVKDFVEKDVEVSIREPQKAPLERSPIEKAPLEVAKLEDTKREAPQAREKAAPELPAGLAVQIEQELPGFSREEIAVKTVYISKEDVKPVSMSPEAANKKLAELLKEKNQHQAHMIQEKKGMEAKFQLAWMPVSIPGNQTSPFRIKTIDSSAGKGQFMRSKTSQTSASLADHVAADAGENDASASDANAPLKGLDAAKAKSNDPTLSSEQDVYFKMLNSRGPRARGGARGGKAAFPQLSIGDN